MTVAKVDPELMSSSSLVKLVETSFTIECSSLRSGVLVTIGLLVAMYHFETTSKLTAVAVLQSMGGVNSLAIIYELCGLGVGVY